MKMLLGCCYTLLLAFIAVVSGVDVKKNVGDGALFKPDITTSLKDSSITWKYAGGGDVIKVIEWDNDFKTLESLNPKFKTRVDLNKTTGELTIRDLELQHTGLYTIEISNKEQEKKFNLIVMERIPKPKLISEKATNNVDVMYLVCKYNTTNKVRWDCFSGEKIHREDLEKQGQNEKSITIKRTENLDVCCTCTLYNDWTEETSNQICRKDLFKDPGNAGQIGLGIGISFIFILFLILILLYLCVKPIYDYVHPRCENKPCLGGIVNCLERCRPKPTSEPQRNNTNGSPEPAQEPNKDPLLKKDEDDKL